MHAWNAATLTRDFQALVSPCAGERDHEGKETGGIVAFVAPEMRASGSDRALAGGAVDVEDAEHGHGCSWISVQKLGSQTTVPRGSAAGSERGTDSPHVLEIQAYLYSKRGNTFTLCPSLPFNIGGIVFEGTASVQTLPPATEAGTRSVLDRCSATSTPNASSAASSCTNMQESARSLYLPVFELIII